MGSAQDRAARVPVVVVVVEDVRLHRAARNPH